MEETAQVDPLFSYIPLIVFCIPFGRTGYLLAKEKGRNVPLWTILGILPFVNIFCMWFFIGAANLRLEAKIDELLNKS